jgi:TRAP-type C4-dicarboxylate transport system permease small subunit
VMRKRLARALFIAVCVGLGWYAWSLWSEASSQYKNEALTIPTILLYVLTLPGSLLVQLIYSGLALVTPIDRLDAGTAFLNWMVKTWGPLTVVGYLQWFVFVPRLIRFWRSRDITGSV